MPYVNVPVPEEHVEEVMQFVLRAMTRASQEPWDDESIGKLFDEVDELSKALLAFVARAVSTGKDLSQNDAASMIQLSGRETMAIQRELNELARAAGRPTLISQRTINEPLPNGRTTEKRIFSMELDVAQLVRDAEQRERERDVAGSAP